MKIVRFHSTSKGWLWAIVIGLLGLCQFHLPQFASKFDKFPGDRGDARLVACLMEHWHQVFQGTANWRSPGMFYPVQGTIGYADLMLGYGIVHSLLRSLGLGIFEAAEVTIILFSFSAYLVCFLLLHKVLRFNVGASIAGAVFFAFNGPKLVQLNHLQLQSIVFLPLIVMALVILVQRRAVLSQGQAFAVIALAAFALDLQLLTGFYAGWFFLFWSTLFLLLTLLFSETRNVVVQVVKKFWPALIGGGGVFIVGFVPFLIAYLPIVRSIGGRPYHELQNFIPVPWSFLVTSPRNYLWGRLSSMIALRHSLTPEIHIGMGFVPLLVWLGVVAFVIWFLIKNSKGIAEFKGEQRTNVLFFSQLVLATCLVYLLGMRYWHGFSPWQFVYAYVPGAQAIRAVSRYALVLALPMSIAFAFVIHQFMKRISGLKAGTRRTVFFILLFFLTTFGLVEQFAHPEGFDGFSVSAENLYLNRNAQQLPGDCSAFYVSGKPTALHNVFEYQLDAAFISTIKRIPTMNGYSGQLPPNWYLWDMTAPGYENNVRRWIQEHQIQGKVCRLFLYETSATEDIADHGVFVRQQYLDLLRRHPDGPGLQTWLTKLNNCTRQGGRGADKSCDRESVSIAILESAEFSERSYFVIRLYLSTLGRPPLLKEFAADRDSLVSAESAELLAKKDELVREFMQRPEFKSIYDGGSIPGFVDKLLTTAANSSMNGAELVTSLNSGQMTRERVVLAVVEDQQTIGAFRNHEFVLMQFLGNLNRDPKRWEYRQRLDELNWIGDHHQLVSDFIYSVEYRKRFGYVN